jgi:hypothetical protein
MPYNLYRDKLVCFALMIFFIKMNIENVGKI